MDSIRPIPLDGALHAVREPSARPASESSPTTTSASEREILQQGRRAFEHGDDATALRCLERLVESGLRFADVHYMIGVVHERHGDLEAAAASLREAIRINPAYVEALVALASVCESQGDFAQSQGHAERAGQLCRASAGGLDPTTRGKLANQQAALADALAQAGLRREAIEQYRQALERCPTFLDIRHRLGVTLREAGLPFQALQEFDRILDAHPRLVESRIQQGLTCYAMGRTADAISAWQQVLALDPTRREAHMYLRLVGQEDAAPAGLPAPAAPGAGSTTSPASTSISGWSTRSLVASDPRAPRVAEGGTGVRPR
jgi:tetratricopeptide (TPR) repeat protein